MRNIRFLAVIITTVISACSNGEGRVAETGSRAAAEGQAERVRSGIEVLLTDSLHLIQGRRVGLLTNHTGVLVDPTAPASTETPNLLSTIDAIANAENVELVALYGPEHGIRGEAEAGAHVESGVDARTGVPIHSLYGATRRPTPEMLADVDILVFDMQDVGARFYTYPSTMAYAMEAAAEHGIPFVVLDRPNPIRGDVVQGTVLDPAYATFVGLYPVPMRHGMTMGELARMFVAEFGIDVELHVVPMAGWRRDMAFDETSMPWVAPSPNMPTLASALAYPGTCLFEGTGLSVGRGTDQAFQWIGAPWLDGDALAERLNAYELPGLRFESASFTPREPGDGKFADTEVHGVRIVAESTTYDASRAAVAMLIETYSASGDEWSWLESHFDRLSGTDALRHAIEAGNGLDQITEGWALPLADFERFRAPYLIYD